MRTKRFLLRLSIGSVCCLGLLSTALPAVASPSTDGAVASQRAGRDHATPNHRPPKPPSSLRLQDDFDTIGAEVHELTTNGRTSYYIDEGKGKHVVVFIGGASTSLQAFQLTEFARTTRERLGIRIVSVERNGLGASKVDPTLGYDDYNKEVLAVLDHLGIKRFSILAISGGGAYGAHLAAAVPKRLVSLHAAAAVSSSLPTRSAPRNCDLTLEERNEQNMRWKRDPMGWWAVPGSPVLAVPGWQSAAYLDAVRAFFMGGQLDDATAMSLPGILNCSAGAVADASKITAPTYLYWGENDTSVPVSVMEQWKAALPNVVKATVYPGEGHTVQYRHWDQILADMAGYGNYTVACVRGRTQLVPNRFIDSYTSRGATLGLCAWANAG